MSVLSAEHKKQKIAFRLATKDVDALDAKLVQTNIGRSEFIRRAVLGVPIHSSTDEKMVSELKRLGALMKHQYPKHSNWTDTEKRQYWLLMEQLTGLAKNLQANILKGQ